MLQGETPGGERLGDEIDAAGREEPIQVSQYPFLRGVLPAERPLERQVASDGGGQVGVERRHDATPGALRSTVAGSGNATSRRSSTARRRYTHVLSRVRWPRRSPIVLSDRPDRKRCTAYECRAQWAPWNGMARPLRFDQAWKASVTAVV